MVRTVIPTYPLARSRADFQEYNLKKERFFYLNFNICE